MFDRNLSGGSLRSKFSFVCNLHLFLFLFILRCKLIRGNRFELLLLSFGSDFLKLVEKLNFLIKKWLVSIRMHIVTCFDKTVMNEHLSGIFLVDIHGGFPFLWIFQRLYEKC